jgi:hypothetical protein
VQRQAFIVIEIKQENLMTAIMSATTSCCSMSSTKKALDEDKLELEDELDEEDELDDNDDARRAQ